MFHSIRPQIPRPDHGLSGEGTASMLSHLQRQNVRPAEPDLGLLAWADTCPGSFDRLWNPGMQGDHSAANEAFAATLTMGLSDI
jgi:hypothetical protein